MNIRVPLSPRMLTVALLCATAALLFNSVLYAQSYRFRTFGVEEGMPSLTASVMFSDQQGLLWIGTNNGLVRYDGRRFQRMTGLGEGASSSVKSGIIDRSGALWLGHDNGVISRYADGAYNNVKVDGLLNGEIIRSIHQGRDGVYWFGTLGGGLLRLDGQMMELLGTEDGLCSMGIFAILQTATGQIWLGTEQGICICEEVVEDGKRRITSRILDKSMGMPSNLIRCLLEASDGSIWIGTMDQGLVRVAAPPQNLDFKDVKLQVFNTSSGLGHNFVYTLFEDRLGRIWAGTFGGGVSRTQRPGESGKRTFVTFKKENGLGEDQVLSIAEDREGNMWFGTLGGGVSRLNSEAFSVYSTDDKLPSNRVLSIMVDSRGHYWFGTEEGLAEIAVSDDGASRELVNHYSTANGLSDNAVLSIYEDKHGMLWIGTRGEGINKLNPENASMQLVTDPNGSLSNVLSITADDDGNLWFGTGGRGVCRYDATSKSITTYSKKDGLASNAITDVFKDSHGDMWFGTLDAGAMRIRGDHIETYGREQGFSLKPIRAITEDQGGRLWFGTEGDGLFTYDRKTFKKFATLDGLSSNNLRAVIYDSVQNSLWVSTEIGLNRYSIDKDQWYFYGPGSGFYGMEMLDNAIYRQNNGDVWFGTVGGAVHYQSSLDFDNYVVPTINISGIKVFFQDTTLPQGAALDYGENFISFDFEGVSLSQPNNLEYQYRLEGLQGEWSSVTEKRSVTYPDLPAGQYNFLVRARIVGREWSEPASHVFEILPPFWQKPLFIAGSIVISGLLIFLLSAVRVRREQARNQLLESSVAERTQALMEQKERLRREKEKIERMNVDLERAKREAEEASRAKSEFLANVTHELRTPMNSIIGFTRRLIRRAGDELGEAGRNSLETVYQNSHRLLQMINEILDYSSIESGRIRYTIQSVDPVHVCRAVLHEWTPAAEEHGLKLVLQEEHSQPIMCDEERLRQVLHNIVGNAVKFTKSGSVTMSFRTLLHNEKHYVGVAVRDTGQGIAPDKLGSIFGEFEQANPRHDQLKGGIGLGLAIAKRLCLGMRGDILVESSLGQGATFEVILPAAVADDSGIGERRGAGENGKETQAGADGAVRSNGEADSSSIPDSGSGSMTARL